MVKKVLKKCAYLVVRLRKIWKHHNKICSHDPNETEFKIVGGSKSGLVQSWRREHSKFKFCRLSDRDRPSTARYRSRPREGPASPICRRYRKSSSLASAPPRPPPRAPRRPRCAITKSPKRPRKKAPPNRRWRRRRCPCLPIAPDPDDRLVVGN